MNTRMIYSFFFCLVISIGFSQEGYTQDQKQRLAMGRLDLYVFNQDLCQPKMFF